MTKEECTNQEYWEGYLLGKSRCQERMEAFNAGRHTFKPMYIRQDTLKPYALGYNAGWNEIVVENS